MTRNPHFYGEAMDAGMRLVGVYPYTDAMLKVGALQRRGVDPNSIRTRRHGLTDKLEVWVERGVEVGASQRNPIHREGRVLRDTIVRGSWAVLYLYRGVVYYAYLENDGHRVTGLKVADYDDRLDWGKATGWKTGNTIGITVPGPGRSYEFPVDGSQLLKLIEDIPMPVKGQRGEAKLQQHHGYYIKQVDTSFGKRWVGDRDPAKLTEDEAEYGYKSKPTLLSKLAEVGGQRNPRGGGIGGVVDTFTNFIPGVYAFKHAAGATERMRAKRNPTSEWEAEVAQLAEWLWRRGKATGLDQSGEYSQRRVTVTHAVLNGPYLPTSDMLHHVMRHVNSSDTWSGGGWMIFHSPFKQRELIVLKRKGVR